MRPRGHGAATDVKGVLVGHVTLRSDAPAAQTGLTVIVPHGNDVFREKVVASATVINGFGKAIGLTQLNELGVLETPIVLTNTLAVGAAFDGLVQHAIANNPDIGVTTTTVNPVVLECNDGWLNSIQQRAVTPEHVLEAIHNAKPDFERGSVGAGTGMMLYGWKGGIGSASRVIDATLGGFTLGVLVLANFGRPEELIIDGVSMASLADGKDGAPLAGGTGHASPEATAENAGSCIVIVATDAPADSRQLGRIARRVQTGLARTGAGVHHGSGEYVVAFSIAQTVPHEPKTQVLERKVLAEDGPVMNALFEAVIEATEDAVIDVLFRAETVVGRDGHVGQAFPVERALELLHQRR